MSNKKLKLNLGCAGRLLDGYVNIDMDSLEDIKKRYPHIEISDTKVFMQCDVLSLPYENESVDEIRADCVLEHLSFIEESKFFYEVSRVLRKGGVLEISVPNFEFMIKTWLEAEDDWQEFFRDDIEAIEQSHWFGQYSYSTDNKWGYLCACIYGPQNGAGQFHKNAYTIPKIEAIFRKLEFDNVKIGHFRWKRDRDLMIRARGIK